MDNPIQAYEDIKDGIRRYIKSAFKTNSPTFEAERDALLRRPGVLFQDAYIEPMPAYAGGKPLAGLDGTDLPTLDEASIKAYKAVVGAGLFSGPYSLYVHQQRMVTQSLQGKHCVVVTGTGSGKTESFLLPALATIVKEASSWLPCDAAGADWPAAGLWEVDRCKRRGETRKAAVRALVLYPMNALVEDQVSRLRKALDSKSVREALDEHLGGNRIRFGRFNGSTPVSGHPVKADNSPNTNKRTECNARIEDAIAEDRAMDKLLSDRGAVVAGLQKKVADMEDGDPNRLQLAEQLEVARNELKKAEQARLFIPSASIDSAEMFHRWEMQRNPPDILVTNTSMLSVMLMRHAAPSAKND